eukprot:m.19372 g.19372  ORF g.19372 m.19372 type:complete len:417 (-) comp5435_c0_seq1:39-1289(-)
MAKEKKEKKKRSGKERAEAPSVGAASQTSVSLQMKHAKKKSSKKIKGSRASAVGSTSDDKNSSFSIFSHGRAMSSTIATKPRSSSSMAPAKPAPTTEVESDAGLPSSDAEPKVVEKSQDEVIREFGEVLSGLREKTQAAVDSVEGSAAKLLDSDDFATGDGVSLLEVKVHLMLSYNATLATLMARKLEGKSIEGHPIVDRLAYIRTVLEKIAPVEAKMKYQMDKYLRAATSAPASGGAADPLSFRPNLGDLTAKTAGVRPAGQAERDDEPTGDGDGVYVPPKIASAPYLEELSAAERRQRKKERDLQRLASSEMFQDLRSEFSSAPLEIRHGEDIDNDVATELREREEIEESNFVRFGGRRKLEKKRARLATDLSKLADFDVTRGFSRAEEDSVQLSMRDQMAAAKKRRISGGKRN